MANGEKCQAKCVGSQVGVGFGICFFVPDVGEARLVGSPLCASEDAARNVQQVEKVWSFMSAKVETNGKVLTEHLLHSGIAIALKLNADLLGEIAVSAAAPARRLVAANTLQLLHISFEVTLQQGMTADELSRRIEELSKNRSAALVGLKRHVFDASGVDLLSLYHHSSQTFWQDTVVELNQSSVAPFSSAPVGDISHESDSAVAAYALLPALGCIVACACCCCFLCFWKRVASYHVKPSRTSERSLSPLGPESDLGVDLEQQDWAMRYVARSGSPVCSLARSLSPSFAQTANALMGVGPAPMMQLAVNANAGALVLSTGGAELMVSPSRASVRKVLFRRGESDGIDLEQPAARHEKLYGREELYGTADAIDAQWCIMEDAIPEELNGTCDVTINAQWQDNTDLLRERTL
jgi:hypothetical protein